MSVLLLSRPFDAHNTEGTGEQVVAREIWNSLVKSKVNVLRTSRLNVRPYGSIISIIVYDYLAVFFYSLRTLAGGYPVVFINSPFQAAFIWLLKLRNPVTIVLVHDLFFLSENKTPFNNYSRWLHGYAINHASHVLTTTEENQKLIESTYGVKPDVIHLGVAENLANVREIKQLPDASVGYIGAYVSRKRPENLLELARIIGEEKNNTKLVFAGRVTEGFTAKLQSTNPKPSFEILGEISEDNKPGFYQSISFLYFPTKLEGFGIPILEAMTAGVIPIVHGDAVVPNCLKSRCVIVDDVLSVTKQVEYFLDKPDQYRKMVSNNKEYALGFSYDNFAKYISTYINDQ